MLQYIAALVAGGTTLLGFFLLTTVPVWWVLFLVLIVLGAVYYGVFWYAEKFVHWSNNVLYVAAATVIAGIALLMVVDTVMVRRGLVFLIPASIALLYGWGVAQKVGDFYSSRTFRRYMMMVLVFDAYASITFFYALSSFFVSNTFFLLAVVSGGLLLVHLRCTFGECIFVSTDNPFLFGDG